MARQLWISVLLDLLRPYFLEYMMAVNPTPLEKDNIFRYIVHA